MFYGEDELYSLSLYWCSRRLSKKQRIFFEVKARDSPQFNCLPLLWCGSGLGKIGSQTSLPLLLSRSFVAFKFIRLHVLSSSACCMRCQISNMFFVFNSGKWNFAIMCVVTEIFSKGVFCYSICRFWAYIKRQIIYYSQKSALMSFILISNVYLNSRWIRN